MIIIFRINLMIALVLFVFGNSASLALSPKEIRYIGTKVWQNECNRKIDKLISWNKDEGFASFGICHCIWYSNKNRDIFDERFPELIQYMRKQNAAVPKWLDYDNTPACPWRSREEFLQAKQQNNKIFKGLQQFLADTIQLQAQYLVYRLEVVLPQILELVPVSERLNIQREIKKLMRTSIGVYSLIDYINFKGDGISEYKKSGFSDQACSQVYTNGWGLLQVLRKMQYAPKNLTANQAYIWAIKTILKCRVAYAPENRRKNEEKWISGWMKRIDTYKINDK